MGQYGVECHGPRRCWFTDEDSYAASSAKKLVRHYPMPRWVSSLYGFRRTLAGSGHSGLGRAGVEGVSRASHWTTVIRSLGRRRRSAGCTDLPGAATCWRTGGEVYSRRPSHKPADGKMREMRPCIPTSNAVQMITRKASESFDANTDKMKPLRFGRGRCTKCTRMNMLTRR